ncbi:bidirectional sugar transporter SWEET14-like [Ananas comosus]|uniref:Bidirectional sugar transporter SWEET n=1 Tax=Ananas comosus TaxID=4615 RepID=A0A6P5GQ63_ANACO|nr:bidirectional sugar transporter SWEET14-like [Ananas comosus]
MAVLSLHHPCTFTFGILGNIISLMVYLAPLPTFYRVYKKKSTEGFQSIPYIIALFSSMLWIYYAILKPDASLLITINSIGCAIEAIYIITYLVFAPKNVKIFTAKILLLLIVGAYGTILLLTLLLSKDSSRVHLVGWICMGFSVTVFVAPLSIMRLVIRTKSVEFMPFSLSFFLTLSAVVWFFYGLLTKDIYVALPNVLGFLFGIMQMVLYVAYKDVKPITQEYKLPEKGLGVHPVDSKPSKIENKDHHIVIEGDPKMLDGTEGDNRKETQEGNKMSHVEV